WLDRLNDCLPVLLEVSANSSYVARYFIYGLLLYIVLKHRISQVDGTMLSHFDMELTRRYEVHVLIRVEYYLVED
ncbi:hypothetical protein Bhyg_10113, partial [Pseudolycoriella hygida]